MIKRQITTAILFLGILPYMGQAQETGSAQDTLAPKDI